MEHVEDEGEIDIAEIIEVLPFGLVGYVYIVQIHEAIVPRLVKISSCRVKEQIPEICVGLLSHGGQLPIMEHIHEQVEVLQALCRIIVALHVVALPEGIHIVIVD